jgi:hypothetical protein
MTLADLIEAQKYESFTEPDKATDEEALGILIARHLGWDGDAILLVAEEALTEANFHDEAAAVRALWAKREGVKGG